jgi:hypothetical protein
MQTMEDYKQGDTWCDDPACYANATAYDEATGQFQCDAHRTKGAVSCTSDEVFL